MNGISEAPTQTDLSRDEMYERVVANDAALNGRFFLGVLTTGIYCLPSCRARRPLRSNVDFFENVDACPRRPACVPAAAATRTTSPAATIP